MQLGSIFMLIGMVACLLLCVRRWQAGKVFRYLPILYGFGVGLGLAVVWWTPETSLLASAQVVAGFTFAGFVFWFAVWIERRGDR